MKRSKADYDQLHRLFNSQMVRIKLLGCPAVIQQGFQDKKNEMLDRIFKMDIPNGNIPFIPVIPQYQLDIYRLMEMLRPNGKDGYCSLNPSQIKSEIQTANKPYFICSVGGGENLFGKSAKKRWRLIKRQPATNHLQIAEVIALCLHTGILQQHEVDCTGSVYGSNALLPTIYLDRGRAKLSWKSFELVSVWWEPFHCQYRI